MSGFPARQVFDGNFNIFQNIPSAAVIGSSNFLPPNPAPDFSALSTLQSALASGTAFTWSSGGGTPGAYGLVFVPASTASTINLSATAVVTWGGVAMTSLGSAYRSGGALNGWGWVFALNGIPGGSQTISVTLTQAGGKTFTGWGSSYSYTNVVSVGALQTATGTSTSPAVAVTATNTTDLVWGAIAGGVLSAFSLTPRQTGTSAPFFQAGDAVGSATVSATQSSSVWAAFGINLVGATGALGNVKPVAPKTANYAAAPGQLVPCDLSGGAFAVTLPTAPADGTNVVLKIISQATAPNTLTFNCGGSDVLNIAGGSTSATLNRLFQSVRLQYYAASSIWYIISTDPGSLQLTSTVTAAGTTTLTVASNATQVFTGTTTQTVKLPTTSVVASAQYTIINTSTGTVTVQSSGANTITTLTAGTGAVFTALVATPTTAANWFAH